MTYQVLRAYVAGHKPEIRAETGRGPAAMLITQVSPTVPRPRSTSEMWWFGCADSRGWPGSRPQLLRYSAP
jgi:hypothetical protein